MENSLFGSIPTNTTTPATNTSNATSLSAQGNEAVLQALLSENAGRIINLDTSIGKRDALSKLAPQSRGLKRLLEAVSVDRTDITIGGIDDALEILETLDDIVQNKFTVPTTV
ncbi:hypothetical protein SlGVgp074 [Spodoptera litura granulovirus]|uniref:P12 n=1 Tax=Spodoptera litura granulovirus TaxID=359919 RepID=A5IZS6_9BBAC|nr:hypothetical protein SlGVgp074 [Spodoptera litura granulovirus]ABQ52017.1 hypothetical protein SlGVgp074 [Spodoptera litura granulovirus]